MWYFNMNTCVIGFSLMCIYNDSLNILIDAIIATKYYEVDGEHYNNI